MPEEIVSHSSRRAAKAPAFQWYPKDCDTDENVRLMDDAEFGFYVRCLNHAWMNDGIPGDLADLAKILHRPLGRVKAYWSRVGKCFVIDEHGRARNPKQELQRNELREFRESRKRAADARWKLSQPDARASNVHMQNDARALHVQCSASASASASTSASTEEAFQKLYSRHPERKRRDRTLAEHEYFRAVQERGVPPDRIDAVHAAMCDTEAWQWNSGAAKDVPTLAAWLNDRGYEHPPAEVKPRTLPVAAPIDYSKVKFPTPPPMREVDERLLNGTAA